MSVYDDSRNGCPALHGAALRILNAVDSWADGKYWLCRETTCFVKGRIDGLLVPTAFDAHCMKKVRGHYTDSVRVCGVEVKVSRADFQRGLKIGQFDRYAKTLDGLYLATFADTCKTAELPPHCGHLVYMHGKSNSSRIVCKRHPQYRATKFTQDQMWQLFFRYVTEHRMEVREVERRVSEALDKIGHRASAEVFATLRAMRKQVESKGDQVLPSETSGPF